MTGLEDLRKVLLSEREAGRLTQIQKDLFEKTHAAVSLLLEKVYAIDDPFSDEAHARIEETMSLRETAYDIVVIRTKKILALAESQAQGNYIERNEIKKMIPPEREMFERISGAIGTCQGALLSEIHQSLPAEHEIVETVPAIGQDQAIPQGPGPATSPAPAPRSPPCTLVRVLADMDAFMGVDGRTYTLAKGDIVTLPERNAEVLVERNIALNMNLSK
jgi:DNA replication factor GINS